MASGFAIPSRYGTSNMLQRLMLDPVKQQAIANAANVRQDKRAVSGISRSLGGLVAQEQKQMMSSEREGEELTRRKDTLKFRKKILDQQVANANKARAYEKNQLGMEFGLGLTATGVSAFNRFKTKKEDAEWRAWLQSHINKYN